MEPSSPETFTQDFRRFFVRGLAALLPTLITLLLLIKIWSFLWESVGQYLIRGIEDAADAAGSGPAWAYVQSHPNWFHDTGLPPNVQTPPWFIQLVGVLLSLVLIYSIGLFVGNFMGRFYQRLVERAVRRIPLIRAVYPAIKQVTDFLLADHQQFAGSRVVAVEPHARGIWSIGLVTGPGVARLSSVVGKEMISVFVPSSPTAFSGYVLVVPRDSVVELPLSVEQALRLLVSGGVVTPTPEELRRRLEQIKMP